MENRKELYKGALLRAVQKVKNHIRAFDFDNDITDGDSYLFNAFNLLKEGKYLQAAEIMCKAGMYVDYIRPSLSDILQNIEAKCDLNGYAYFDMAFTYNFDAKGYLIARIGETMTKMIRKPHYRSSNDDAQITGWIICLIALNEMKTYAIQQELF